MKIGSLFSGAGALDLAIREVFGGETVFVADICKVNKDGTVGHHEPHRSPCSILAHRFPGVPNLGDVSLIDWTPWRGRIDILIAGFPCQDVSVAGVRAGLKDGTRTGLWSQVVRAIRELQPRLVVLENVPGIFTAPAAGDVEPCTWCVGDDPAGNLRALDAVLADLSAIGFDAEWTVVPASGVGAPHKRERWFAVAYPCGRQLPRAAVERDGLPVTPERAGDADLTLLPTPTVQDGANNGGPSQYERNTRPLNTEVLLLPTPTAGDSKASGAAGYESGHDGTTLTDATVRQPARWGEYEPAIRRWGTLTRPAPEPTKLNAKGNPKLSDEFDEWLMGWPVGWVTDVPGVTWNEALKACGNGVVIQQAVAAMRWLLTQDVLPLMGGAA